MYFTRAENENSPLQETQWLYLFSGEGGDFVFFFWLTPTSDNDGGSLLPGDICDTDNAV